MDEVGLLVKALIRENPLDLLIENRKYLEFANIVLEVEHSTKALQAVMEYAFQVGRCPENIDSVIHFIRGNRTSIPAFEKTEGFEGQLNDIAEDTSDKSEAGAAGLIDQIYLKAYNLRLANIYAMASQITTGAVANPNTKEKGPAAAEEYVQEEKGNLVVKTPHEVGGELHENLDHIQNYINSFILGESKRIYTGFRKIDEITLMGKGQRNRWIGILGYTHHGKSLLLSTMLYNMACHGANILLCPRESSVDEAWMGFVWLHHSKVCPKRPIAERAEWMRIGKHVGMEKYNTIQMIVKDLREGTSIPGKIVVEPCKSWEEVEDKLHTTNKKYNYDVLAIDYFAHLDTEGGSKRDTDMDKYKKALRKAQMLSMNGIHNDQSGLVIITPLQANRKGYEEASKQEGDRYGVYENLNAVEYFTQAAHDMDCVMSVWYEGDACREVTPKQVLLHCMKARGNMIFPDHRLEIHPDTGLLSDITSTKTIKEPTTNDLSDSDADKVLYTKTNWNP
jgi:hypothetical protein